GSLSATLLRAVHADSIAVIPECSRAPWGWLWDEHGHFFADAVGSQWVIPQLLLELSEAVVEVLIEAGHQNGSSAISGAPAGRSRFRLAGSNAGYTLPVPAHSSQGSSA